MYEEKKSDFNWLSLFIKVVIFVVFILLAIWLIARISSRKENNQPGVTFESNIQTMKTAAIDYFKGVDLPTTVGKTKKITLKEMIDKKLLLSVTDDKKESCDSKKSYAEITKKADYYSVKVELICGKKKDTIYGTISSEECKNCNTNTGTNTNTGNNTNTGTNTNTGNNSNNNTNNNNSGSKLKTYYEYNKKITNYSEWYVGTKTGNNIETSTKKMSFSQYCPIIYTKYYTTSYISKADLNNGSKSYSYTLLLKNVPTNAKSVKNNGNSYFQNRNDYSTYLDQRGTNLDMVNNDPNYNANITSVDKFIASSLNSNNFIYNISNVYSIGYKYYVDITIYVTSTYRVMPYSYGNLKEVYFVPITFNGQYTDMRKCKEGLSEDVASYEQSQIISTYTKNTPTYRYVTTSTDIIWSTETSVPGYTKTGKTKQGQ